MTGTRIEYEAAVSGNIKAGSRVTFTRRNGCDGSYLNISQGEGVLLMGPRGDKGAEVVSNEDGKMILDAQGMTVHLRPAGANDRPALKVSGMQVENWIILDVE